MAKPDDIVNGTVPDATEVMAWMDFLADGKGLKSGTYTALKTAPGTDPFLCVATGADGGPKGLFLFCGDIAQGDYGFFLLVTWG
jgi:hypothetical protein